MDTARFTARITRQSAFPAYCCMRVRAWTATACAPLSLVVDALASLSGTCLPIDAVPLAAAALSCGLCLALWAWWPRVSIRGLTAAVTGAALILGLLRFPFGMAPDAIVMLDVGQGDAFIVRSGENVLLIDTGNQDALLKAALARQRVGRLDAVAVTHSDDDHCGSLPVLGDVAPAAALLVRLIEIDRELSALRAAHERPADAD